MHVQPTRKVDERDDLGVRPLTARSVVASTLLGMRPPELTAQLLVRSGELFGIAEGTTRTALSRMLAAGELTVEGGRYRLSGHLLDRQARQDASRRPAPRPWRGDWRTAVVTADRRTPAARAELRTTMRRAHYGELREGVWLRPDNLAGGPDAGGDVEWLVSRPGDPGRLVARLWDLDGWADRAGRLRAAMAAGVDDLAPAFVVSAAVLRHLQADPLLPVALLPDGWPGDALRSEYDAFDAEFKAVWREWFRSVR